MSLIELIRKRRTSALATAIPAISAIHQVETEGAVARIATIAVANPTEEKITTLFALRGADLPEPENREILAETDPKRWVVEIMQEAFEERAAIMEFEGKLPRAQAELEAARMVATLARNKGYSWAALRAALAAAPELLKRLPKRAGPVDSLPLGVSGFAILPTKKVIPQGKFKEGATNADKSQPA